MEEFSLPLEERALSQEELDLLLSKLHPDRQEAGQEYLFLLRKLTYYFQSRNCPSADNLADETLDRVAHKLVEGLEPKNISAYSYGIAKNVWLEYLKKPDNNTQQIDDLDKDIDALINLYDPTSEIHNKELGHCIIKCLKKLPENDARIYLGYWFHDDEKNKAARKKLTQDLNITPAALRLRVHRIRQTLQDCLEKCFKDKTKSLK